MASTAWLRQTRRVERTLLECFRAGKREALQEMYWEHVESVEAVVSATLNRVAGCSPADVADVVQDVFAKAFTSRARAAYDGTREYRPFLCQLARNTVIDWLRRRKREHLRDIDLKTLTGDVHSVAAAEAGPFGSEVLAATERFIRDLPPELRAVHERRFLAAESQERAASSLGISRQNLRTLERRLLEGLRRELRAVESTERELTFARDSRIPGLPWRRPL